MRIRNHGLVCVALLTGVATGLAQTKNAKLSDLQIVSSSTTTVAVTPTGYPLLVPSEGTALAITVDLDAMRYTGYVHHSGRMHSADLVVGGPIEARLEGKDVVVIGPNAKRIKARIFRRERLPAQPSS